MILSPENVKPNLEKVRARIARSCQRSGRKESDIILVGVVKNVDPELIRAATESGLEHLGENYLQEARRKQELIPGPIVWHFIGHLQRKKSREVIERFRFIHSLDRKDLAEEINRRAGEIGRKAQVLIEVNLAGEESKSGINEESLPGLIDLSRSLPHLSLVGLMTMPPPGPDPESSRPYFRRLRVLREKLAGPDLPLPELSMGMSLDLETAVEEGATMLRIGTAIFGPRKE
ncbi:MAG: YggS family pyridoxal phosphate-dependent enzyme [Proteobacteria bacterium]|nr:YggS family pyridoxal phosphate-dependent enzyme [Pseudomonadota bacterium]